MTKIRTVFLASAALLIALPFVLGACVGPPELGLQDGRLRACPGSPNCVSSEGDRPDVPPLPIPPGVGGKKAMALLGEVLADRAQVVSQDDGYLHAVFTSRIFRFKDDFEARLEAGSDPAEAKIHVRSASRVGYSDLGANRRRVDAVRAAFKTRLAEGE